MQYSYPKLGDKCEEIFRILRLRFCANDWWFISIEEHPSSAWPGDFFSSSALFYCYRSLHLVRCNSVLWFELSAHPIHSTVQFLFLLDVFGKIHFSQLYIFLVDFYSLIYSFMMQIHIEERWISFCCWSWYMYSIIYYRTSSYCTYRV